MLKSIPAMYGGLNAVVMVSRNSRFPHYSQVHVATTYYQHNCQSVLLSDLISYKKKKKKKKKKKLQKIRAMRKI